MAISPTRVSPLENPNVVPQIGPPEIDIGTFPVVNWDAHSSLSDLDREIGVAVIEATKRAVGKELKECLFRGVISYSGEVVRQIKERGSDKLPTVLSERGNPYPFVMYAIKSHIYAVNNKGLEPNTPIAVLVYDRNRTTYMEMGSSEIGGRKYRVCPESLACIIKFQLEKT